MTGAEEYDENYERTPSPIKGQMAEVHCTVTIKRAATGITETHELVGYASVDSLKQLEE